MSSLRTVAAARARAESSYKAITRNSRALGLGRRPSRNSPGVGVT